MASRIRAPDQGERRPGQVFEVAREAATAGQPRQRPLHDPALRQHDEAAGGLRTPDDAQSPASAPPRRGGGTRPPVTGIGEDGEDEGEQSPCATVEHQRRAVAVLEVGGVHHHAQQQAGRVDEHVVRDAPDLLARIEADRVDRGPPFSAALTDLLSRMAAVGLASLPARSRQATWSRWCTASGVPSHSRRCR